MKKLLLLISALFPGLATGQNVFWSENFSNGGLGWSLNLNGPGTNDSLSNEWIINSDNSNCPPCGISGGNYLHVTCSSEDATACPMFGGPTCIYNAGGWFPIQTDKFVFSPDISTDGKTNITLQFNYFAVGEPGYDYGTVRISNDGGVTWTDLAFQYAGFVNCQQEIINIPALYENIPNFRIGFRWINNDNFTGTDPSFSIDDIELSGDTLITSSKNNFPSGYSVFLYPDPAHEEVIFSIGSAQNDHQNKTGILIVSDIYGKTVETNTFQNNKAVISDKCFSSGIFIYHITLSDGFSCNGKMILLK